MRLLFLLFAFVLTPSAHAADERPPAAWQGVWQGKVGDYPIRLCLFDQPWMDGETNGSGAYYYMKQLKIISLDQKDASSWIERPGGEETPKDPVWRAVKVSGDTLTGDWTAPGKQLPIKLTRVDAGTTDEYETSCGSDAFNAPRVKPMTVKEEKATKDGFAYTKLVADVGKHFDAQLASFALGGSDTATKEINRQLRELLTGKEDKPDYLDCMAGALSANGSDGYFEFNAEPAMITRDWLSVDVAQSDYCGGAHPNHSGWSLTFDRRSGQLVDLGKWFTSAAFTRSKDADDDLLTINPKFRKYLIQHMDAEEAECVEVIETADYWDIGLVREGIAFTPELPHVATACEALATLGYKDATRYVNDAGKSAIASITANIAALPK